MSHPQILPDGGAVRAPRRHRPRPASCRALQGSLGLLLGLLQAGSGASELLADPLPGRLFHSAADRAAIDRSERHTPAPAASSRPRARPPQAPEHSSRLSGFVLRSDGHDSYWLDSSPADPLLIRR